MRTVLKDKLQVFKSVRSDSVYFIVLCLLCKVMQTESLPLDSKKTKKKQKTFFFYGVQGFETPTMIQCAKVSFDPGCTKQLICRMNKQPEDIASPCPTVVHGCMLILVNSFVRPKSLNDGGEGLHVFTKFIWTILCRVWLY